MKFGPHGLEFTAPAWAPCRRRLTFLGRGNTLFLQETALVIEGNLLRFKLPVLDRYIQRAFCEWSTVTITVSAARIIAVAQRDASTPRRRW